MSNHTDTDGLNVALIIDNRTRTNAQVRTYGPTDDAAEIALRHLVQVADAGFDGIAIDYVDSVPNNYGYPADTDCYAAVQTEAGVVIILDEIPANKATLSGAVAACIADFARPYIDKRFTEVAAAFAAQQIKVWAAGMIAGHRASHGRWQKIEDIMYPMMTLDA